MKKLNRILLVALAAICIVGCSDDKDNTLTVAKGNLVTEISLDATADGVILDNPGDVATVKVIAKPTNAEDLNYYEFRSGDTKVFTVDNKGVVTAKGPGVALLSVVAKNNADVSATCNVVVVGKRITSIEIGALYKNREVTRTNSAGPTFDLSKQLTILPLDADVKLLKYTSSNPEIATVSENGIVTAIWEGEVQIKAEAMDRSGISDICNLKVNITPIATITVGATYKDFSIDNLFNGTANENQSLTITKGTTVSASRISYTPTNATRSTMKYTSSDPTVVAVTSDASNNPVIKGLKSGKATIKIEATDGHGAIAEATVSVYGMLDRASWIIGASSADGSVKDGTDNWGGPIVNLIRDGGDTGGLIKPGAAGGPVVGGEMYFTVDMKQATAFDYCAISGTWSGNFNSGVKVNKISLYGSNDGTNFTTLEENLTVSTGAYNTFLKLQASYNYRYVKAVLNPAYPYNAAGGVNTAAVTHCVVKDFRLAKGPQ